MMISPRPEVLAVAEAVQGAINYAELRELGIDPATLLDFSASVNPFGPSPRAMAALNSVPIDRYPDREATELRRTLSARLDVPMERLIAGNGSSELLNLIALAYLRVNDAVVIVGPTYAEYARAAVLTGARIVACDAVAETQFAVPAALIASTLRTHRPRALFLCNPNNPTGQCVAPEVIRQWAAEFPQTLFVIDEAYIEFTSGTPSLAGSDTENVIVLRSLTKAYSLAGLRLGYGVAAAEIVRVLCRVRLPWSVNAFAQVAGIAAVRDDDHLQQCLKQHVQTKTQLEQGLKELELSPIPSSGPYFLVPVDDAVGIRKELLSRKILVRDCSSFGLPKWVRLSPRCLADNRVLLAALQSVIGRRTR